VVRPTRFLLAEDDDDHAALVARTFAREQPEHRLDRVRDGEAALQFLRRQAPYENAERPEVVLLRLPARPGTGWQAAPGLRARVLPDERVTVPAGTFDCVVVLVASAEPGEPSRETYWIAPGVGFVRVLRARGDAREEAVLVAWSPGATSG
jgi:hypothetical protein